MQILYFDMRPVCLVILIRVPVSSISFALWQFIEDFCLSLAPATSGNGDFGDWNAFPSAQPAAPAAQPVNPAGIDLFPGLQAAPASTAPSADLFDLMGTSQMASFSTSQSMNFAMTSSQTMGLSMSKSQVSNAYIIFLRFFKMPFIFLVEDQFRFS